MLLLLISWYHCSSPNSIRATGTRVSPSEASPQISIERRRLRVTANYHKVTATSLAKGRRVHVSCSCSSSQRGCSQHRVASFQQYRCTRCSEAWRLVLVHGAQIAWTIRLQPDQAFQWRPDCAPAQDAHTWWSWRLSCAQPTPALFAD